MSTNGHTNGAAVLDKVRAVLDQARADGQDEPGRGTVAELLGISESQARTALEKVRRQSPATPPATGRQPVASPAPSPATRQAGDRQPPAPPITVARHVATLDAAGIPPAPGVASPPPAPQSSPGDQATQPPAARVATTSQPAKLQPGARLFAWLGFGFGSVMSIAANVLHTWLPAPKMPDGWSPDLAPQIGAAVWPIGLLISVEVLSRVSWRPGPLWGLARYGGAGTVAIGSGVISYGHLHEVLVAWGYGHPGADVGPLVLDGLMVVCGFALLAMSTHQAGDRS